MPSIYEMTHSAVVTRVLGGMRQKLSENFGVTLVGNRVTVRWNMDGALVDVHMIVENVTTPKEYEDNLKKERRYSNLFKKYEKKCPYLESDLYFAEYGEHLQ